MDKKQARMRRAMRARAKIRELGAYRLCVYRTPRHMYAQVIGPDGGKVVASASTVEKELRQSIDGQRVTRPQPRPSVRALPSVPSRPELRRWHSIAPASATTAGSRPWPMRHGKTDWSSKRLNDG